MFTTIKQIRNIADNDTLINKKLEIAEYKLEYNTNPN